MTLSTGDIVAIAIGGLAILVLIAAYWQITQTNGVRRSSRAKKMGAYGDDDASDAGDTSSNPYADDGDHSSNPYADASFAAPASGSYGHNPYASDSSPYGQNPFLQASPDASP